MSGMTILFYAFPTALLAFGFVVTFGFPRVEAPQPPYRWHWLVELILPGTSPSWGALGGLAVVGWFYFLFQLWIYISNGTPYIIAAIALPNLSRSYGVTLAESDLYGSINPGLFWIYGAPVLLFVVNVVLVLRSRVKASGSESSESSE